MLKQTAVYWELSAFEFDNYGQPIPTSPIEIKVRWEDVGEEFINEIGTTQLSRARVYVDRDVEVGGILMLGTEDDITDSVDIKENDGAWEIKRFEKLPTLNAKQFLRTCYL